MRVDSHCVPMLELEACARRGPACLRIACSEGRSLGGLLNGKTGVETKSFLLKLERFALTRSRDVRAGEVSVPNNNNAKESSTGFFSKDCVDYPLSNSPSSSAG